MQGKPSNSRQAAVILSKNRHRRAKLGRMRDQLYKVVASHHYLRHEFCNSLDTLSSEDENFSALLWAITTSPNDRRRRVYDTNDEQESERGRGTALCKAVPLIYVGMTRMRTMVLHYTVVLQLELQSM